MRSHIPFGFLLSALTLAGPLAADAPFDAPRPQARPLILAATSTVSLTDPATLSQIGFERWIRDFRATARAAGISDRTFDAAFAGARFDPKIVDRDRNQNEFTKTIWDYLDTAVSDARVANGRKALAAQKSVLAGIEAEYGVPAEIVTAIWGLESAYGGYRGNTPTLAALATLAYEGRRAEFFEAEVLAALAILEAGETTPDQLRGSWAGAMGHTQFMPSSYLELAIDHTGDGRRDIWSDDPSDALASTAAYLAHHGWQTGVPWGIEVLLPQPFDYMQARRDNTMTLAEWRSLGVTPVGRAKMPDETPLSLLLPAGADGAAFLISDNFEVLERYNTADAYVIAVGHLADRIGGAGPLTADWPRQDRALSFDERIELQTRLRAAGFDPEKIDGRIGPLTISAVRDFQKADGARPDGYVSLRVLERLRDG
ncbi:Membrane-bound lytic murein transglycosylase B precursor [Roseivivax sp. THAF40]|uniref:lytic murein transglycosylase n=1 Tax=unclassified Roseivivax TaxID=2639302 RepID=UPI001267D5E4|nr:MULTISPECIES: lytic murein transglycosylase [unclassified Roseivivax]QFS81320.1 Membrane-bound lytic murein transglycosylase B precursor [Roseivivax sp. THAF197b]QFT45049.1 Membrane-bound lytic murein transglycosylase B precursor [Roseivivax sp. THAF40]